MNNSFRIQNNFKVRQMSTPSSTLSARPHSRALQQRPSSSLSQRPPSSASFRPQSRVSRPSSRISRPATRQSTRLLPLFQKLVTQLTGFTPENDEEDFRIALDFVSRNLEHATATKGGPSSDMATMDKRFYGYIQLSYLKQVLFSQCMFLQFYRKIPYTIQ